MKQIQSVSDESGLFKGEWIVILLIFLVTGVTAFLYTKAQLSEKEHNSAAVAVADTPTLPPPTATPEKGQVTNI